MKLEFKLNKRYLLVHALRQHYELPFSEWEDLQNKFWEKYPDAFYYFGFRPEDVFLNKKPYTKIKKAYE